MKSKMKNMSEFICGLLLLLVTSVTLEAQAQSLVDLTTPSNGTITYCNSLSPYLGTKAFDDGALNDTSRWLPYANTLPNSWVQFQFNDGPELVNAYRVWGLTANSYATRSPKAFKLEGSNDGNTWTLLDSRTDQTGWTDAESRFFEIDNSVPYSIYKFTITANNGSSEYTGVSELEFFTLQTDFPPDIANADATGITASSAWLSGNLSSTGTASTAAAVYWGSADGGTDAAAWANTNIWAAPQNEGLLSFQATGLSTNETYFFRFAATNDVGMSWADETRAFITGEVTLQKVSDADEATLSPGSFIVTRGEALTGSDLLLRYEQTGGTAVSGVDFAPLSGSVTILAGETSADIAVTPLKNFDLMDKTTLELTLMDAQAIIGSENSAAMTIFNQSLPSGGSNTWVRSGTDALASTDANWSLGHAPTNTDAIILLGQYASEPDMTWDLTNSVASWTQTDSYTGTVTIATKYPGQGEFTNMVVSGDVLLEGGTWTHVANPVGSSVHENRLRLSVGGDFVLGDKALFDVSAKGFSPQRGPAPGGSETVSTGASHGGMGSPGYNFEKALPTYGSVFAPECLGSGGRTAEWGGGAVWLEVDGHAAIDGKILASANDATVYRRAGSSGGSIYIHASTVSGGGLLEARGGYSWGNSGSGGGGRIAVILSGGDDFGSISMNTLGKMGSFYASASGTIYLQKAGQEEGEGILVVDNGNMFNNYSLNTWETATLIPDAGDFNDNHDLTRLEAIIITNTGKLAFNKNTVFDFGAVPIYGAGASDITKWRTTEVAPAGAEIVLWSTNHITFPNPFVISNYTLSIDVPVSVAGDWVVSAGGALSHSGNFNPTPGDEEFRLDLEIDGNLTVQPGGVIEANTRGYFNGYGPSPSWTGQGRRGASHGGLGGYGRDVLSEPSLATYGSALRPTTLGSGGGLSVISGARFRNGGGSIILVVHGTTTVDGIISARQILPTYTRCGGSAGGSIMLDTEFLNGSGKIEAWGDSSNDCGAGGGGRIAVRLTSSDSFGDVTMDASGNTGSGNSAAGTIYREVASGDIGRGVLTIANSVPTITNVVTYLPASGTVDGDGLLGTTLEIDGTARVALQGDLRVKDLFIDTALDARLYLKGHTLRVDSYRHPDWGDDAFVVYDGGQIIWRTGSVIMIR